MTINDLRDFLAKYVGEGKGDAHVYVCDSRDNPTTDSLLLVDATFYEKKNGDYGIVLQTG